MVKECNYYCALLTIVHSAIHGTTSPAYLHELLPMHKATTRTVLRSNEDPFRLAVVRSNLTSGDKAFTICGPKLWNNLPVALRSIKSSLTFKKHLKTYLFNLN